MWDTFQTAKIWHCRPSALVNVVDPYEAYCLDQAVTTWGNYITSELEKIEGKDSKAVARKQRSKLLQLLGAKDSERFRTVGRSKKV